MRAVLLSLVVASSNFLSSRQAVALRDEMAAPDHQVSMISKYMAGGLTKKQLYEAAEEQTANVTWRDAVDKLKHDIPKDVVTMLSTGSTAKQPFEQAALDRARNTLNGMIETAQAEYDLKDMECMAFDERNRMEFQQTMKDLSRVGAGIAADNALILSSKMDIKNALSMLAEQDKLLKAHLAECDKTKLMNEAQLATLKSDLAVAEFIVSMTECKEGASLLQSGSSLELVKCPMADGTAQLSFKDGFLAKKAGMMQSAQGKKAMMQALLATHPKLDDKDKTEMQALVDARKKEISAISQRMHVFSSNKTEEAPSLSDIMNPEPVPEVVPPKTEPAPEEAANKCVLGKADCGLLTDNMALMWGEVKDAVDELTTVMADNEARCKAQEEIHNGEIATWQGVHSQKSVESADATSSLNSNTEEQTEGQQSKEMLEKEYEEVHGECVAVLHEILFTKICGTKIVRGELAKFSDTWGPTDLLDCVVSEWIPEECSVKCVDQVLCGGAKEGELPHPSCAGGVQNMTRNVIQNESLGAACPAELLTKTCGEFPCAINCAQTDWSEWGKCSKECGGGLQQRARNTLTQPDNGGEECGPGSDVQDCNVASCDRDCEISDWTVWGPCSKACNSGTQERIKEEISPKVANGEECAHHMDATRYEQQTCNDLECPLAPTCVANQDVVLAVDVSGSLKQEGFDTMMTFVKDLTSLYHLGEGKTKIGVLEYSKEGKIVAPLQNSMDELVPMLDKITFQRGVTDMAQGLSLAKTILMEGRKNASSVVILLTDGKPSFKFATTKAAQELRDSGVRLVIVPIFTYGDPEFMNELCSDPVEDNVLPINGLEVLANDTMGAAINLMTSTCAMLEQPEEPVSEEVPLKKLLTSIFNPKKPKKVRKIHHRPHH
jgi:hypothetical protein